MILRAALWAGLIVLTLAAPAWAIDRDAFAPDPVKARVENPLEKASVGGKYRTLLRAIRVPRDQASYGYFYDYGMYSGTNWAGYDNLPPGHWVYVYPYWYIWRDCANKP
jgi:hypothetical protein